MRAENLGGAKPQGPFKDKRTTITTRITEETRRQLDDEAAKKGWSLSQEIEARLVQSFRDDLALGGDARTAAIWRGAAAMAATAAARRGWQLRTTHWLDDYTACSEAFAAAEDFLLAALPPRPQQLEEKLADALRQMRDAASDQDFRFVAMVDGFARSTILPFLDRKTQRDYKEQADQLLKLANPDPNPSGVRPPLRNV